MMRLRTGWGMGWATCLMLAAALPARDSCAREAAKAREHAQPANPTPARKPEPQDDSFFYPPAKDLALQPDGERKAEALARYVEGARLEESGESEKALEAFEKVLDFDPGQVELATRVAYLLIRQEDFPRAIDVLKDATKAQPKDPAPYVQLAFIYAKYLKKTDQALKYANEAVALDAKNIDSYQQLYETYLTAGDPKKAMQALDRAAKIESDDPAYWIHLGKLYAKQILKVDGTVPPDDLHRANDIFRKALQLGASDVGVLKEVADYYAASQQVRDAIPLYLKVLELQPDDTGAREKLATGFLLTDQRAQAITTLAEIIKLHPEKFQSYDLLGQLLMEDGRALEQAGQTKEAQAEFARAAQNFEQSLLINPSLPSSYLRLAELLIVHLKDNDGAIKVLSEAQRRFSGVAQVTYLLAIALREAKRPQQSLTAFEEALHEAELDSEDIANGHFYFEFGAAAEQAGLYDKATELFKKSIEMDPANAAEAYNYLGFMWVEQNTRLSEAADDINHALALEPENGAYIDSLGWLYYRQGKYEQALTELLRAVQNIQRDDATVFDHVADTYLKLNKLPQALEYWRKALVLDPDNKKLAEKIESAKPKMSKGEPPATKPVE